MDEEQFTISRNELLQLGIDLQNLGVGTVNHIMFGRLQSLEFALSEVEEGGGWTEELSLKAKDLVLTVRRHITAERIIRSLQAGYET